MDSSIPLERGVPSTPRVIVYSITFWLLAAMSAGAAELFVAPDGRPTNNGSAAQPLDLATALSMQSPARPGDTIWLRGGIYRGIYTSYLTGTANARITVRAYPGERATLDGNSSIAVVLTVYGAYATYWGFEIMSSDPRRLSQQNGPWPSDLYRGQGIFSWGTNIQYVNLVLHDLQSGIGLWSESVGSEIYGSIIYHNGWQAPDGSHGHGIYTQNRAGVRLVRENITFNQFSHGIHAYGSSSAFLNDITLEGNVAFNNGVLGSSGYERDLLLGGGIVARNPVLRENYTYGGAQSNLGYGAGCTNGQVTNNYFVGGTPLIMVWCTPVMTGNVLYNLQAARWGWNSSNFRPQDFPSNSYYAQPPTSNFVKVRPNSFEPGRGHVIIYNWKRLPFVDVDLSPLGLAGGAHYEIRDAQNFYGPPVVTGFYNNAPVPIPMTGLVLDPPVGSVPVSPVHTGPEFGVFVVLPTGPTDPNPTRAARPSIAPSGGHFTGPVTLTLASTTPGAAIRYTTDGTMPTSLSSLYTGPVILSVSSTVMARAFAPNMLDSDVSSAWFDISSLPVVSTPTITPLGGSHENSVTVSLASATPAATIRYTVDGSTPTVASSLYLAPFRLTATATVRARAFAANFVDSAEATASFRITSSPGATATSSFVGVDSTSKGNWQTAYGRDGYMVIGDESRAPAYATVTATGQLLWTWSASTSDPRALQRASGSDRVAATWYERTYTIDINLTDGQRHRVSLYSLDWENTGGRTQRVEIRDAVTDALLDSRTLSAFGGGQYLVWELTGHVKIQTTRLAGRNAVTSGLFFDPPGSSGTFAAATFVAADLVNEGTWRGVYGSEGAAVAGDVVSGLALAQLTTSGHSGWTWSAATADTRALQRVVGPSRVAATWYGQSFSLDVNVTDGQPHQVALYAVDWDNNGRKQRVDVRDALSGAILDSRTMMNFGGGQYLVWRVSGHVIVQITRLEGVNAVISGFFMDPD